MQFTFLGTSSGMPSKQRNVTALAIMPDRTKRWYLVDCGEATQHQLLHTPLTLNNLEAVLITHVHGDHCYGLTGLLASAATQGRTRPLTVIGPTPLKAYLDAVCQHTYLSLPYELDFFPVERVTDVLALEDFAISRIALSHRVPSFAFRFTEINHSPQAGYGQASRPRHSPQRRLEPVAAGPGSGDRGWTGAEVGGLCAAGATAAVHRQWRQ